MQIAFTSGKSWLIIFIVSGITIISEIAILAFKCLFFDSVSNYIKLMKDKDNVSEIENKLKFLLKDDIKPRKKELYSLL